MSEYAAEIIRLPETRELHGCDNVRGATFFGLQAIVGKDEIPGTLGVLFVTESQLSPEFLSNNNLYRHAERNVNPDKKGYFEDNGRVRAQKFRGHRSDAFWMPIEAFDYLGSGFQLDEGVRFQSLNIKGTDHEICKKYIPKGVRARGQQAVRETSRVSEKFFPKHIDTSNYFRNQDRINDKDPIVVTQKLHGTSVRFGRVPVPRKLSWLERLAKRLGVRVQETQYEVVAGSRNVNKTQNPDTKNFYATDIYTLTAEKHGKDVPEGYVIYGELIGWTPDGQAIQKGYTYRVPFQQMDLYVYRVAFINDQGIQQDLSWEQVKIFCDERGWKYVPEIAGRVNGWWAREFVDVWIDTKFSDVLVAMVPLEDDNPCDEGVVVRLDTTLRPEFFKAKSPMFLEHETKMLDKGEVGMEI